MSTYIELCNKVIQESANELNELTLTSWNGPEAGRRLYPRVKRLVSEAWKMLQMERDEWEFKSAERSFYIEPAMKIAEGYYPLGSTSYWKNDRTGDVIYLYAGSDADSSGSWDVGDWAGQRTFSPETPNQKTILPEDYYVNVGNPDGGFRYKGMGTYDFREEDPTLREIQWTSFVAFTAGNTPRPMAFVHWDKWLLDARGYFNTSSSSPPEYVTQAPDGSLAFFPQTTTPFYVSFTYDTAPQILTQPTDVPILLKEEYHDWIAWKALTLMASYDKNATLLAWATKMETFYKRRAEKELMPIPQWGTSRFNEDYL